jgi:hypothetical protein
MPLITGGRYYFADAGTPHLSARHNYGSRNWHDTNWPIVQTLGENLTCARPWDDGAQPAAIPLAQVVGTLDCITNGESLGGQIDPATLIDGFAPQCFLPKPHNVQQWERASAYSSCSIVRFYERIIDWMYADNVGRITAAFLSFLGPSATVNVHTQANLMPSVTTVITPYFSVAVVDGTRDFQQLALQAFQSISRPTNHGAFGTLPLWYEASSWIHSKLTQDGAPGNGPVFLCGHSYGAAAALVLAGRYRNWNSSRTINYLTFGCPKIGDTRLVELVRQCAGTDLANDNDIVTVVPPDYATLLPVMIALGMPNLAVWADWIRPPNQLRQDADGTLVANAFPLLDFTTLLGMTNRVLSGQEINPIVGHPITEYLRRTVLRCPDAEWPLSPATIALLLSPNDRRIIGTGGLLANGRARFNPVSGAAALVLGGKGGGTIHPHSLPAAFKLGGDGGTGHGFIGSGGMLLGGSGGTGTAPSGSGGLLLGGSGGDGTAPAGDGGLLLGGSGGDGTAPAGDGGLLLGG